MLRTINNEKVSVSKAKVASAQNCRAYAGKNRRKAYDIAYRAYRKTFIETGLLRQRSYKVYKTDMDVKQFISYVIRYINRDYKLRDLIDVQPDAETIDPLDFFEGSMNGLYIPPILMEQLWWLACKPWQNTDNGNNPMIWIEGIKALKKEQFIYLDMDCGFLGQIAIADEFYHAVI